MKRIVGLFLLLLGLAIMLGGLAMALQGYVRMVTQAVEDPMAEHADTDEPERAVAGQMLTWAIVGGTGAPVAVVGLLLSRSSRRRRRAGGQALIPSRR